MSCEQQEDNLLVDLSVVYAFINAKINQIGLSDLLNH